MKKKIILVLCICILIIFIFYISRIKNDPSGFFKKYCLDPIPKSVTDIKYDQISNFAGYEFVFGFRIEREDVNSIIHSKSLTPVLELEYINGLLYFKDTPDHEWWIPIYDNSIFNKSPSWFHPELWNNLEAYVNINTNSSNTDNKIFIYNKDKNEAYFYVKKKYF